MTVEFRLTSSVVPSPGHQTRTSVEIDPGPSRFAQGLLVFLLVSSPQFPTQDQPEKAKYNPQTNLVRYPASS